MPGWRQSRRHARISGNNQSRRRIGIENRLLAGNHGLNMVVFFRPGLNQVPAHAIVERKVGARPPTVLCKGAGIMIAEIEVLSRGLRKTAGKAQQEISESITGLGSVEVESAIEGGIRILVHLVVVKLKAGFKRVPAEHLGNRIVEIESIVPLFQIGNG